MKSEDPKTITFSCIRVVQPIGEFFIASIPYTELCEITHFDVRRIISKERDVETYLGIQRPLQEKRVDEIGRYVRTLDASFPTSVIIAVDARCAEYDEKGKLMTLHNYISEDPDEQPTLFRHIARVLDGQHRLAGLEAAQPETEFQINVSLFVDIDISVQANIFATVNLAQTKVNRSLAYDLFELAKSRSPQKTCHNIAVALDQSPKGPFAGRIKRLGMSREGHFNETLTQATFVESLMRYVSKDPLVDRDIYLRGKTPARTGKEEASQLIFRDMFIDEKDLDIAEVVFNFFSAVRERWPTAWASTEKGFMLSKTNGFRAFMRMLRPTYLRLARPGGVPKTSEFLTAMKQVSLSDADFNVDKFKPGTSGESALAAFLIKSLRDR
jgi:DGQHR domain-containing protein